MIPDCTIEGESGYFARVKVRTPEGEELLAIYDLLSGEFMVPFEGSSIKAVEWKYRNSDNWFFV